MKQLPPAKSKQAVIDLDTGKKFTWTMMRDVDQEKIQNALKEAFAMNGYGDSGKIGQFIGAFKGDLKEKAHVTIVYDADKKDTSVSVRGGGSATVAGVDFMKAVWSIWFGKNRPADARRLSSSARCNNRRSDATTARAGGPPPPPRPPLGRDLFAPGERMPGRARRDDIVPPGPLGSAGSHHLGSTARDDRAAWSILGRDTTLGPRVDCGVAWANAGARRRGLGLARPRLLRRVAGKAVGDLPLLVELERDSALGLLGERRQERVGLFSRDAERLLAAWAGHDALMNTRRAFRARRGGRPPLRSFPSDLSARPLKRSRSDTAMPITAMIPPSTQPTMAPAGKMAWRIAPTTSAAVERAREHHPPATAASTPPIFAGLPRKFTALAVKGVRGLPHAEQKAETPR